MNFLFKIILAVLMMPMVVLADHNPAALGSVHWTTSLEQALTTAKKEHRPVFLLFQEVPGCSGCQSFGRDVLSQQLIVEAIEDLFVPLLIYNNRGGYDERIRKTYKEPAWNYQVIRFLDPQGKDIIPRRDRVWTIGALSRRMIAALEKQDTAVPAYLKGLALSYGNPRPAQVVLAMPCFWNGEMAVGGIDGVIKTDAGFYDQREVTRVWYDPKIISLDNLIKQADGMGCAAQVYLDTPALHKGSQRFSEDRYRPAPAPDQKKQLEGTPLARLELTGYQATKANAWVRRDYKKALSYLSPRQRRAVK